MKRGRARRAAILSLCPRDRLIVDVGANHGHVAAALGAIATERHPQCIVRGDIRWVVADGLAPFSHVPVAIIAGMGAHTILGILNRGPRPDMAILHAPDDPPLLRTTLAQQGWRIDAEVLAPEARRHAEVLRVVPGQESSTGLFLHFGPRLLEGDDPLLRPHLRQVYGRLSNIARGTHGRDPAKHKAIMGKLSFIADVLRRRWNDIDLPGVPS